VSTNQLRSLPRNANAPRQSLAALPVYAATAAAPFEGRSSNRRPARTAPPRSPLAIIAFAVLPAQPIVSGSFSTPYAIVKDDCISVGCNLKTIR
jgi:hypothetical protein